MVEGRTTLQVAIMRVISRAVGGVALGSSSLPPTVTAVPSARGVPNSWSHIKSMIQCTDARQANSLSVAFLSRTFNGN